MFTCIDVCELRNGEFTKSMAADWSTRRQHMNKEYFQWDTFIEEQETVFPVKAMKEVFLLDPERDSIWLSEKTAEILFRGKEKPEISRQEFEEHLSEASAIVFRQELQRILSGKEERVSCHAAIINDISCLSSVIYLYRLEGRTELLGFLSVDYEPTREYDMHMEEVVQKLGFAQTVNELIVEGACDYIYQLDLVNNICTFSSKALEVLPLESPTFTDAMNCVLSFIVPEDRQIFLDSFTPFLMGQSDRHVAEYRVMTKQGNIMWISCQGKGIHDEQGRPIMIAGSLMDITEKKKHEEELEKMLYYDPLTGLKNRLCFEKDMEECLSEENSRRSFLYMDIRKFKLYNELFGHSFGNRVLKEFSYMLQLYFPKACGIYRFSGDEFLVHIKESNRGEILDKLAAFRANLKKTRELEGHTLYINAYIAVVIYPENGRNTEELLNNANQCLYRMTREDKEEVSFFAGRTGDEVSQQFLLENEMRKDIENNFRHFRVVYQPIVRVNEEGAYWIGTEALLRYQNPDFPNLEQMEMIKTLEYSGLIIPVGRWVVDRAVQECGNWNRTAGPAIVHVNIAAQQVADSGFVEYISNRCKAEGLPVSRLLIELTETSLVNNSEVATNFCEDLMRLGIGVALDDFGTGYSSFNYLRKFPISQIKVDREYARQIQVNRYNQIIVTFLHKLSEELQMELCVEGVETEEELEVLQKMGISMIQGFYFERPLEADIIRREFPQKVKKIVD